MGFEWASPFRYKDSSTNNVARLMGIADELNLITRFLLEGKTPTAEQREMMNDTLRQYEFFKMETSGYVDL